jgi:hypothetical protein
LWGFADVYSPAFRLKIGMFAVLFVGTHRVSRMNDAPSGALREKPNA